MECNFRQNALSTTGCRINKLWNSPGFVYSVGHMGMFIPLALALAPLSIPAAVATAALGGLACVGTAYSSLKDPSNVARPLNMSAASLFGIAAVVGAFGIGAWISGQPLSTEMASKLVCTAWATTCFGMGNKMQALVWSKSEKAKLWITDPAKAWRESGFALAAKTLTKRFEKAIDIAANLLTFSPLYSSFGLIGTGLFPSAMGHGSPINVYTELGFASLALFIFIQTNNALRARTAQERIGLGRVLSGVASLDMLVGNIVSGHWPAVVQHALFAKGNFTVAKKLFKRSDEATAPTYPEMARRSWGVCRQMLHLKS